MKVFDSTAVDKASYLAKTKELIVTFTNGATYIYQNVTRHKYLSLCRAASAGRYLHQAIIKFPTRYPYERVN